jgi:hypothetical protein
MYEKDGGRLKGSFAGSEERSGTASRFRADRLGVSPKAYTIPYKLWGMSPPPWSVGLPGGAFTRWGRPGGE